LRLDPNFAEGWVVFGELLHAAGRQTEALKAYRRGAALDPTMAGVFHNLGNVAMALGWTDSAVVHYEHVLSLEPNFVEARNNLGRALEDQGRWSEALTAYRRCVADSLYWTNTDDPVGGAWFNRARAADHLGYLDEAFSYREAQRRLADDERFADTIALSARQQLERLEQR
jgi:tetratricopeptide (TPR) repeat protein